MSDEVIVQVGNPAFDFSVEEAERLVAALQNEGLEAWCFRVEAWRADGGAPPGPEEVVLIWLALRTGEAIVNQVVGMVVEWMREQFRQDQYGKRPKRAIIMRYEGVEGQAFEVVELEAADAEPVRRRPQEEFERYTRTKPPKL